MIVLIIIFLSIIASVLFYTYKAKEKYNNIVPLKIYTHWNTKDLPDVMK